MGTRTFASVPNSGRGDIGQDEIVTTRLAHPLSGDLFQRKVLACCRTVRDHLFLGQSRLRIAELPRRHPTTGSPTDCSLALDKWKTSDLVARLIPDGSGTAYVADNRDADTEVHESWQPTRVRMCLALAWWIHCSKEPPSRASCQLTSEPAAPGWNHLSSRHLLLHSLIAPHKVVALLL